ncbi:MAG: hypothetical protein ACE5J7_02205 [Candidatus Aenigmatarchaeota archaeon]
MVDWKIVVAGIVIIAIIASAILATGMIKGVGDIFSLPQKIFKGEGVEKNVSFSANLSFEAFEVDVPASSIEVSFNIPNSDVYIDNKLLNTKNLSEVILSLDEFEGKISVGNKLGIEGTAGGFDADGIGLETEQRIPISTENLSYNHINIMNTNISGFSFSSVSGAIAADNGKISITVEDDKVVTGPFSGDILVSSSIEITGSTTKIEIPNENEIVVSQ